MEVENDWNLTDIPTFSVFDIRLGVSRYFMVVQYKCRVQNIKVSINSLDVFRIVLGCIITLCDNCYALSRLKKAGASVQLIEVKVAQCHSMSSKVTETWEAIPGLERVHYKNEVQGQHGF